MMRIYIKGMKMPKCCRTCHISNTDFCGFFCPIISWRPIVDSYIHKRHDQCPLIELPPHGRLIDADALIAKCGGWYTEEGTDIGFIGSVKQLLDEEAPTIIPAEEGEI